MLIIILKVLVLRGAALTQKIYRRLPMDMAHTLKDIELRLLAHTHTQRVVTLMRELLARTPKEMRHKQ